VGAAEDERRSGPAGAACSSASRGASAYKVILEGSPALKGIVARRAGAAGGHERPLLGRVPAVRQVSDADAGANQISWRQV
jgi:hypothetical protein